MRGTRLNAAQNRREDIMYEQVMRDVSKTLRGCASGWQLLRGPDAAPAAATCCVLALHCQSGWPTVAHGNSQLPLFHRASKNVRQNTPE